MVTKTTSKISLKKPRAVIYVRVSTEEQAREGFSLNAQESALKEYVHMMGYDLYKIYRDEGKSAKDIEHRPALQQLLKDAEKKYFKAIFVYKLDRFSRSLKDLILTIERLKSLNIDFISLQDKIETASASGKLMFHIISSFAEFERDIISERTRFGMIEKAKEGGVISKAPFGYKIQDGLLVVDPEKKELLIQIFKTFLESDKSLNSIALTYNLTVRGLIKILQNKTYIGQITFKESYLGTHEPILDKELFEAVNKKLAQNSYNRDYLRSKNLLLKLNSELNSELLEELALALANKTVKSERKTLQDLNIDLPESEVLKDILGNFKIAKYVATEILLEEGFNQDEIEYDRVLVNADRADIYASNDNQKQVYIDCTANNLDKLLIYLNNDIEFGLVLGDTNESLSYYRFSKSSD
jgi:DNA invertase Pin-like site-specific DNA recombinase